MKPKKPDRFDEIVKARMEKDGGIWSDNAADLLRNEHAWMRRMVRSYMRDQNEGQWFSGYESACVQILSELDQRRK